MPQARWSARDERQYAAIKESCRTGRKKRSMKTCTRIAAATVNKRRAEEGRTLSGFAGAHQRPGWLTALVVVVVALPVTLIATSLLKK